MSGAPKGNNNKNNGAQFRQALRKVMARSTGKTASEGLIEVAEQLYKAAKSGEQWAVKEIADRFDGKPHQSMGIELNDNRTAQDLTDDELAGYITEGSGSGTADSEESADESTPVH